VRGAHEADLFFAELMGESLPAEAEDDASDDPAARWSPDRPEPFFGDESKYCWKVVGRPGKRLFGEVRADDLVVRRAGRGWRCTLSEDLDSDSLFRAGSRRVRRNVVIIRRVRRFQLRKERPPDIETEPELVEAVDVPELVEAVDAAELAEACGFFGPNSVRRTEQEVRAEVVARATAEWGFWHTPAGATRSEGDAAMFGRLVSYYLAPIRDLLPDALVSMQANLILGAINFTALLAPGATPATVNTEAATIRTRLFASAPGGNVPALNASVESAIKQARQAHTNSGDFSAWSAAFISACVRSAGIQQGLEAMIPPGRTHFGKDALLRPSLLQAGYTLDARGRRAATPRKAGYHAFTPAERAPRVGDIIVQDRREAIKIADVVKLATLPGDVKTHGDIVVEVDPAFVVTIGGNLGDSSRKRRYPLNAQGFLPVDDPRRVFRQESDAGVLPALANPPQPPIPPAVLAANLGAQSMARIFAVLSLVEDCVVVPGQPVGGGVLT